MSYKPNLEELEVLEKLKWDNLDIDITPILFENVYAITARIKYKHIPINFYFTALANTNFSKIRVCVMENADSTPITDYIEQYKEIVKRQLIKHRLKIITGKIDD